MNASEIERREHYLNVNYGIRSWLFTTDHKRIAWLYLLSVTLFFFIGGLFATLIRLELMTPQGDLVQAETYNKLFTMHGVTMVFFFLIPSIPAVLGNFLVPMMIGARDLAFPRLNLASWYIFVIGGSLHSDGGGCRRRGHGMDLLYALQQYLLQYPCRPHGCRGLCHRLLFDSHRAQLYCHDPQNARARYDLVSSAAFHLGALRDQHYFYSRHPGHRHYLGPGGTGADFWPGDLRSGFREEIRCCSSISSGSIHIPRSTSWFCLPWVW